MKNNREKIKTEKEIYAIEKSLKDKIKNYCKKNGCSKTWLFETAVSNYIDSKIRADKRQVRAFN